jgi:hypothetical protein
VTMGQQRLFVPSRIDLFAGRGSLLQLYAASTTATSWFNPR